MLTAIVDVSIENNTLQWAVKWPFTSPICDHLHNPLLKHSATQYSEQSAVLCCWRCWQSHLVS